MSSDAPAIEARGLGKAYLIYQRPHDRLRQAIEPRLRRAVNPLLRALGRGPLAEPAFFSRKWALRDINFSVAQGETVGIVGRNGSGKSTLLQMVCGTLNPTEGEVVTRGRVAALLELGSGFNPEYSGRENVFMNASVLGLTREETRARLDDILAFADIGDFIDQPVKTYSSGMAMRLAFAVIAHVDADILVIDEALAVGDAFFQQKCMRWLHGFREHGTVLFCGHDTGALISLCQRAIWLDHGSLRMTGTAKDVAEAYAAYNMAEAMGFSEDAVHIAGPGEAAAAAGSAVQANLEGSSHFGSGKARISRVNLTRADGGPLGLISGTEEVAVVAEIDVAEDIEAPICGFHVKDRLGQALVGDNSFATYADAPLRLRAGQRAVARFVFRLPWLASGRYSISMSIAAGTLQHHVQHHWVHDALIFEVNSPFRNGVLVAVPMQEISLGIAPA